MKPWKNEVLGLLNDGEFAEALQCFRRHHGFVNRFVCKGCGYVSKAHRSEGCYVCGSRDIDVKILYVKEEKE